MPGSSSDTDPQRMRQPARGGQGPAGLAPTVRDDQADGPAWLLKKAAEEDWGAPEWLRWERLRARFLYLRVEPLCSDSGSGFLSCFWLDDDPVGLPTISCILRSDDPFPVLDALTRLMTAVATDRRRQVRELRWGACDFTARTIIVSEAIVLGESKRPKSGHVRTIPMFPSCVRR